MSIALFLWLVLAAAFIGAGLTTLLQGFTARGEFDEFRPAAVIVSAVFFLAVGAFIFGWFFYPEPTASLIESGVEFFQYYLSGYFWKEEQPYLLGGLAALLLIGGACYRPRYWKARLFRWAERRGFRIISAQNVSDWSLWHGWAIWRKNRPAQFDVEIEDQLGTRRKATVGLGPAIGLYPNRVSLVWDDAYAPRRTPRQLSSKRFVPMDEE